MPLDAHLTLVDQANPDTRLASRLADLERRLKAVEQSRPIVQVVTGSPSVAARDGTFAADTGNKIWLRINGAWRFVAVA